MPRGRKKSLSYGEQVTALEASIAALRDELRRQEAALKEARELRDKEELGRLYSAIRAHHLNVDDVLSLLETEAPTAGEA